MLSIEIFFLAAFVMNPRRSECPAKSPATPAAAARRRKIRATSQYMKTLPHQLGTGGGFHGLSKRRSRLMQLYDTTSSDRAQDLEGVLDAVADAMSIILDFDYRNREVWFVVQDIVGALLLYRA